MYLFFDTETTGLPAYSEIILADLDNWPRLVQLAYLLYDENKCLISGRDFIIKPCGFVIPADASRIHGITTEKAIRDGHDLRTVLKEFQSVINQADYLIAHNMNFDENIIRAEYLRNKMRDSILRKKRICTMESTTNFCAIDGYYGYKWPKLSELYFTLFKTVYKETHNAADDVAATAKCFWELKRLGEI